MSAEENEQFLCRICLQHVNVGRNIFETLSGDVLVANILIECADIEASADDKLPANICTVCLDTLDMLNEFRMLIKSSDALLRETTCTEPEIQPEILEDFKADYLDTSEVSYIDDREQLKPEPEEESLLEYEVVELATEVQPAPKIAARFNCCSCKDTFDNAEALHSHFDTTHSTLVDNTFDGPEPAPLQCNLCFKSFPNMSGLKKHKSYFQNLVACSLCDREVLRSLMGQHISAHHESQECDVCQKVFKKSGLNEHKEKMHSTLTLNCEQCSKQFSNKIYLNRHVKTVHCPKDPKKLIPCSGCKKLFINQSVLRKHIRIHSGEKPFRCDVCGASFTHNTDHRRHMWTHTGSPHQCKDCHKSFDRPRKLQNHVCNRTKKSVE